MGNAVLQELFGPLSNDLNALADLATAVALFAAIGSYRLAVKQMRNDSYIKASEWSINFADTFRAEVLPRMKLFSFVSSEVSIYAQAVMSPIGSFFKVVFRKRIHLHSRYVKFER